MVKLPHKNQIEFIVWKDAVGDSSRVMIDAVEDVALAVNTNLGWVIHENEDRIVLAHGTSTTGEVDHFVIPKNCIVERIHVSRKRRKCTKPLAG